jgi:hypothetical protein
MKKANLKPRTMKTNKKKHLSKFNYLLLLIVFLLSLQSVRGQVNVTTDRDPGGIIDYIPLWNSKSSITNSIMSQEIVPLISDPAIKISGASLATDELKLYVNGVTKTNYLSVSEGNPSIGYILESKDENGVTSWQKPGWIHNEFLNTVSTFNVMSVHIGSSVEFPLPPSSIERWEKVTITNGGIGAGTKPIGLSIRGFDERTLEIIADKGYGIYQTGNATSTSINYFKSNIGIDQEDPVTNLHIGNKFNLHELEESCFIANNLNANNERTDHGYSTQISFGNNGSISLLTSGFGEASSTPAWNIGLHIDQNGYCGIGLNNSEAFLEIADMGEPGDKYFKIGDEIFFTDIDIDNTLGLYGNDDHTSGGLKLGSAGPTLFGSNGNLGIGTLTPQEKLHVNGKVVIGENPIRPADYKLYVEGGIIAEKVKVELASNWSDFVFEPTYHLRPLSEVEQFVKENKHLPEIPSAAQVEENGIDLGEMDAKLLQKVEELTLYIIEQQKQLDALKAEMQTLKK